MSPPDLCIPARGVAEAMPRSYSIPTRKAYFDTASSEWRLPLTQGFEAVVDGWNVEFLEMWNWHATQYEGGSTWYGARQVKYPNSKLSKHVYLHRVVAERAGTLSTTNLEVDHIDNNGLNNRACNLRLASSGENKHNRPAPRTNTSGYKGVSWDKRRGLYRVQVKFESKTHWGGHFDTAEAAYAAACELRERLHGKFARHR
jgi:hypothetical protein